MSQKKPIIKSFATFLRNVPEVEEQAKKFVVGAVPSRLIDEVKLPTNFDGRQAWKQYLSPIKDQGHCGMCYSCSTVASLADRYSILTLNQVHEELSASDMVICMTVGENYIPQPISYDPTKSDAAYHKAEVETRVKFGCNGNTLYNAGKWLYIQGAPTVKCIPDSLVTSAEAAKEVPFCEDVEGDEFDNCTNRKDAQRFYRAGKAYQIEYIENDMIQTEKNIMYDIYKWGPMAAGFLIFDDFLNNCDGTNIYTTKGQGEATLGHAIKLVGWGESQQDGRLVKYWICANSWSTDWGDDGYFKVERFLPGINLEKNTMCLVPDLPGIPNLDIFSTTGYITDADRINRRALGMSLAYLYPYTAIDKIHEGLLLGDLVHPIIDSQKLPKQYSTFVAGKIGTYDLNSIINASESGNHGIWIFAGIIIAFLLGCLATFLYLRRKWRI